MNLSQQLTFQARCASFSALFYTSTMLLVLAWQPGVDPGDAGQVIFSFDEAQIQCLLGHDLSCHLTISGCAAGNHCDVFDVGRDPPCCPSRCLCIAPTPQLCYGYDPGTVQVCVHDYSCTMDHTLLARGLSPNPSLIHAPRASKDQVKTKFIHKFREAREVEMVARCGRK